MTYKDPAEYLKEWNELHRKYTKLGSETRNSKMADYCEEMIMEAKKHYYGSGNTIMEDSTYDRLENCLKVLRPDSKILDKVGY